MKKLKSKMLLLALSVVFMASCQEVKKEANHDGYTISGTVNGIDNVYIKMLESGSREASEIKTIDSVKITNGKFEFKGKVDVVDMVSIVIDNKYNGRFMLENSDISIEIDLAEDKLESGIMFFPLVKGSKSHDLYNEINQKTTAVLEDDKYKELDVLRDLFAVAKKSKDKKNMDIALAKQQELRPLMEERGNAYTKIKYDFARNNPSSPVAVHVLGYQYSEGRMTKEELKEFYNLFKDDARKTGFFKYYITKVYKDNFENLGIGNTAPDFTLNSVNNEALTLSQIKGKYLLVDFWASWCIPCRASFPHLKELRKEYEKDGFTIVGIGTADVEDKWRMAIEEDETPWIHLFDASEKRAYGAVAIKYGVPFLPTTFLMDSNRKIILRNPSKEELDNKLKELFKH